MLGPVAEVLAELRSVEKRFGALTAVAGASCAFEAGRVHAVCGENGAGKSTLLKLAGGLLVPDSGEVFVGNSRLFPHVPAEAIRRGFSMVMQHFALVPVLTALENVILGAEPTRGRLGRIDWAAARSKAEAVLAELGVDLALDARVETLGVGDRQRLEIARALYRDARLVVLDEPTAVLTRVEAGALYATLRRLADAGRGVVVVTHKMDEVEAHADVVTVMRRGRVVFTREVDRAGDVPAQIDAVTRAIMGDEPHDLGGARARAVDVDAEDVVRVSGVHAGRALRGLDLSVRAGEIVGVAGVEGNGQRELLRLLSGELRPDRGEVSVGRGAGHTTAVVREDRQAEGLVLDATLRDNLVLGELGRWTRWGIIDAGALDREAEARLRSSGAPQDLERTARTLSGGNQQKIVMARALARLGDGGQTALVAAQPTRGVDIGASADIRQRIRAAARAGAGVLVISSDLDELRQLAGRIVVLRRGAVVAELSPDATDEELGRHMLGRASDEGPAAAEVQE
jgi:general nucleoside transport system ATP-binding protein